MGASQSVWTALHEAIQLDERIGQERGWKAAAVGLYWSLSFRLTRMVECLRDPLPGKSARVRVLNFGCGNRQGDDVLNSDLIAPHRWLLRKPRPDLHWTGLQPLRRLRGQLEGVVCEHVIEHLRPKAALSVFGNLRALLAPGGVMVVSFPDVRRVLDHGGSQGYGTGIVGANSLIYRHGHCFMYDAAMVAEMLAKVGFAAVRTVAFDGAPLRWALDPGREPESTYVIGVAPAAGGQEP